MFWIYRVVSILAGPFLPLMLWLRELKGKEERLRRSERRGQSSLQRPDGHLIWVHVASVGESLSVLPLIGRILERSPDSHILVTSTTVTSATVLARRLPERAFHQFVPVDRPKWMRRFFDTWDPDLCLIVESELWPNMLYEAKLRARPCVLVNGRMSQRSGQRWEKMPGFIRQLLQSFDLCLVQDSEQVERYKKLGAKQVIAAGNLKLVDNRKKTGDKPGDSVRTLPENFGRPCWLAASTHEGEERIVLDIHERLIQEFPDLLTILVPRHPERRMQIINLIDKRGTAFVTRTSGASLEKQHRLFLVDTIGELTEFFSKADISLICGSLVPGIGGHNPVEGAQRGTAIVLGPHMDNFRVLTRDFLSARAAIQGFTSEEIGNLVGDLLADPAKRNRQIGNARTFLKAHEDVLPSIMLYLEPFLPARTLTGTGATQHDSRTDTNVLTPFPVLKK